MVIKNGSLEFTGTEAELLSMLGASRFAEMKSQLAAAATTAPQATPATGADANAGQTVAQAMREVLPAVVDALREASRGDEREPQQGDRGGATYERTSDGRYVPVPRDRSPLRALSRPGRTSRCVPERLRPGTSYLAVAGFEEHEASAVTLTEALRHENVASSSSPWIAAGVATIAGGLLGAWLSSE